MLVWGTGGPQGSPKSGCVSSGKFGRKCGRWGVRVVFWVVMSAVCPWDYENTLSIRVISDASDKHQSPIILRVVSVSLNELTDCTSQKIRFIYSIFFTQDGHLVLEDLRHPQASLVGMFLHRHFLWSFWILETIRLTVSRMRFSFGLLDRDFFFKPNKVLKSEFRWFFGIRFTPD